MFILKAITVVALLLIMALFAFLAFCASCIVRMGRVEDDVDAELEDRIS